MVQKFASFRITRFWKLIQTFGMCSESNGWEYICASISYQKVKTTYEKISVYKSYSFLCDSARVRFLQKAEITFVGHGQLKPVEQFYWNSVVLSIRVLFDCRLDNRTCRFGAEFLGKITNIGNLDFIKAMKSNKFLAVYNCIL